MSQTNPISALADVDPKKIGEEELAELLEAASAQASTDAADLSDLQPEQFAKLISRASAKQVEAVMARPELRVHVLDEVFRRMSEHYKSDKARSTEAVVRWRIGTDEQDTVRYESVLSGGTCTVNKEPQHDDPRVTIMITPVEFLKLVSGNASAPVQFMTGKLKVAGDVGFAAGLTKLFQIPKA
ncbi:SCP2 sterol-binding domain-containing protein [Saccharopolyspora gloriosae]|uniref:SCP2 sterol-binding domain-containing protein n=1 Tax=Saccharopolyspora gloriosae TaxID=455344 RepID=UPI001FB60698|nr:SCP2 sterol-binding domain-containing protein [Saccharopolyspora gloriosae]